MEYVHWSDPLQREVADSKNFGPDLCPQIRAILRKVGMEISVLDVDLLSIRFHLLQ